MLKNWILPWIERFQVRLGNWTLFLLIFITLFILPLFIPLFYERIFNICLTLIIMISVYATSERQTVFIGLQVALAILAIWLSRIIELPTLNYISNLVLVIFFLTRVFKFIGQVSKKKEVSSLVIIEAINGYLLMGIAFGGLIDFVTILHPGSFSFTHVNDVAHFYDPYYYSFVTMSTLGYGDLLPQMPPAKAIAILITLCGQIYLVTIMAFLIGRLLSQGHKEED